MKTGSSPRVRETLYHQRPRRNSRRFIPACAGNILNAGFEKCIFFGSSPRVRETLFIFCWFCPILRFIPACAGNISASTISGCIPSVHPRVCGKHIQFAFRGVLAGGSSPRVRETSSALVTGADQTRFIPACAGNIIRRQSHVFCGAVHPRVCGKHRLISSGEESKYGSSPRVRETLMI